MSETPVLWIWKPSPEDAPWDVAPRDEKGRNALWGSGFPRAHVSGLFEWEGYWISLGLIQQGRSLDVNYIEVRAMRPSARGKPKPITKTDVLKRLPLSNMVGQLEQRHAGALLQMLADSKEPEDDPGMARLREWVGRLVAKRLTEQIEAPPRTGRGRPPKPPSELQVVAKRYAEGGRRKVIESFPNYGKSTIDHWIRKCRDLGMIPEAERKEER